MATLQAKCLRPLSSAAALPSLISRRRVFRACLQRPTNLKPNTYSISNLPTMIDIGGELKSTGEDTPTISHGTPTVPTESKSNENHVRQLHAIAEAAADRAQMHTIICEQRNGWNHLLLHSVNSISLTASLMAGVAAIPTAEASPPHLLACKLSAALLFTAATAVMLLVNRIQPSQLAEEQRNATRLFGQLESSIRTTLAHRAPTKTDVEEAMERILALDEAYPLALIGMMLEKFPETVKPTVWWPRLNQRQQQPTRSGTEDNGWSEELEKEMRGVLKVVKLKDEADYMRVAELFLKINKILAVLGPLFAGLAAVGASLIGTPPLGPWPALVGVLGGALAAVVNMLEHGGQVGMVFELHRNCAGFFQLLMESIAANLEEREVWKRENGDLFELKVALELGRSLSELKGLASYSSSSCEQEVGEFASKLF